MNASSDDEPIAGVPEHLAPPDTSRPAAAPASTPPDCAACETLRLSLAELRAQNDAIMDKAAQVEQERDALVLKINQLAEDEKPAPAPAAEVATVDAEIAGAGIWPRIQRGLGKMW